MQRWALLLSMASSELWACVCAGYPSVKEAWEGSPVVLVAHVESAIPESAITVQIVTVRAEESFKGSRNGQVFHLKQPGHDCAPKFKTGEHVLLYLNRQYSFGLWEALGCGRTRALESATDDLRFLRALPGSAGENRIAGGVVLYENSVSEGFRRVHALSGIRVHLRSGDNSIETVTAEDGVYELYHLPPGVYRISIDIPKGTKLEFPVIAGGESHRNRIGDLTTKEPIVKIGERSAAHVDFVLMIDNQISGRVLDSTGKPMKDVCVELQPATGDASRYFYISKCAGADGSYLLTEMPPGQYVIAAELGSKGKAQEPKLFYPGTVERKSAGLVTIGRGEHLAGFDIRMPR